MLPRLSRGEYWLLVKAVEYRLPLSLLSLPEGPPWDSATIDLALNCNGHGLNLPSLQRALRRFVRRGWIRLFRGREPDVGLSADAATLADGLFANTGGPETIWYELTTAGGTVWEQFARPNWSAYIGDEGDGLGDADEGTFEARRVIASDQRRLHRYMEVLRDECELEPDSERYTPVPDWQPIYWKPPMSGVECAFRYRQRHTPIGRFRGHESMHLRNAWCEWR